MRANLVEAAARSAVDQEMLLLTDDPTPESTELEETGEGYGLVHGNNHDDVYTGDLGGYLGGDYCGAVYLFIFIS